MPRVRPDGNSILKAAMMKTATKRHTTVHLLAGLALRLAGLAAVLPCALAAADASASGEGALLFAFSNSKTEKAKDRGLSLAYSSDSKEWKHLTWPWQSAVLSEFGKEDERAMLSPFLFRARDGEWHCIWGLGGNSGRVGHSHSDDLFSWRRQNYPEIMPGAEISDPVAAEVPGGHGVFFKSGGAFFRASTKDFRKFSKPEPSSKTAYEAAAASGGKAAQAEVEGLGMQSGRISKIPAETVSSYIKRRDEAGRKYALSTKTLADIARELGGRESVKAEISVGASGAKAISPNLMGVFFEDINYGADGGLYAELVQNRDFESSKRDNWQWKEGQFWSLSGDGAAFEIMTGDPVHANNSRYGVMRVKKPGAALRNAGFDGIFLKKGEKYDFSMFSKALSGKGGRVSVRVVGAGGKTVAECEVEVGPSGWKKSEAVLTASEDSGAGVLELVPQTAGDYAFDMVSLFPQKTFKNRKNGLRADIAQAIADIKPKFVRFPGGCVAHGRLLDTLYHWKDSIGPLEARKPMPNIWGYHATLGLGYAEYFQFCEDIGAEPLPVVAAGVGCQFVGKEPETIPMDEMPAYVQDVLDLIEWANGDAKTTKWGRIRAENGHPEPYNLKYLGVGNEDLINDAFKERFEMIFKAVKEKHPEISVIGTCGPGAGGMDYDEGWRFAREIGLPIVDEHYYVSPGWFFANGGFYDGYDRSAGKVYVGEYAGHNKEKTSTVETAVAAAMHLANLERNGDVVVMSSYAPLLGKKGATQWNPDLIYFDGERVYPTVDYHVQKLFGTNSGDVYYPSSIKLDASGEGVAERVGASVVKDSGSGDYIVKLVNALPAKVEATVSLPFVARESDVEKTVLTGDPDSSDAEPAETSERLGRKFEMELPANSLTVLRFKKRI